MVSRPIEEIFNNNTITQLLELVLALPEIAANGQGRIEVLWRTLVGDCESGLGWPAPMELARSFYYFILYHMSMALISFGNYPADNEAFWTSQFLYESIALSGTLPNRHEISAEAQMLVAEQNNAPAGQFYLSDRLSSKLLSRFNNATNRITRCRSLIVTEKGRLGLGPTSTQPGNVIAFVKNAKVPFLLDSLSDSVYEYVGEAYIHGLMFGELAKAGPLELEAMILQ
jgi:hypothetical protein